MVFRCISKLEFVNQNKKQILKNNIKIIIPYSHNNLYTQKSLGAYGLDFYFQKKNEIIFSKESILIPNLAPTGNFRKELILKLRNRMRDYCKSNIRLIKNIRRIYITRKNSLKRKLIDEEKIIPILKNMIL